MNRLLPLLWLGCLCLLGSAPKEPVSSLRPGLDRALFFATANYEDPSLQDLQNPIQNAKAIAARLENEFGFSTEVVPDPSLEEIENKLIEYRDQYAKGRFDGSGQLFIFFSGHGEEEFDEGYYLPRDADPRLLRRTALPYSYWRGFIDNLECQHILVAIDACYSVTFDPSWQNMSIEDFQRPGELSEGQRLLNKHLTTKARLFFTSDGRGDQTPDKSSFAKKLQEGLLNPGGVDGILTSSDVWAALSRALPNPHRGEFGSDEVGSSFLFVRQQLDLSDLEREANAWERANRLNTAAAYRQYLEAFPQGDFANLARQRERKLISEEAEGRDLADWSGAKSRNTVAAYEQYLATHPQGRFAAAAKDKISRLKTGNPRDLPDGMVFIQGGTFQMGDVMEDKEENDEDVHTVTVSDFYLAATEVSFAEFDAFCDATGRKKPEDEGWGRGKLPVINVDWYDCIEYCNWLSEQRSLEPVYTINKGRKDPNNSSSYDDKKWLVTANWRAKGYRLPTEVEWEYAARAVDGKGGGKVRFGNGENVADAAQMNFYASESYKKPYSQVGTYRKKTVSVDSFNPNSLGLYNLSGNVWEWCWDWYDSNYYKNSPSRDPQGPSSGSNRVYRGGSWNGRPVNCRVASRGYGGPDYRGSVVGFRVARSF